MKQLIFLTVLGAISFAAKAQLTTQRWEATISIPNPTECFLQFDHDTMKLFTKDMPAAPVESMRFTAASDTLTLVKLDGQSPCDNTPAVYRATVKDNVLQFASISDACDVRVNALIEMPWKPYTAGGSQ